MCKVDKDVIIQCEESCGSERGMKEVTGTSCECGKNSDPAWVLHNTKR
ncbi:hypothetical protein OAA09_00205 [bacterium]|nr:hypothetical protein [bacterium]